MLLWINSTIKNYNVKLHGDYAITSDAVYSKLLGINDLILTNHTKENGFVALDRTDNVTTVVVKGNNIKSDVKDNYEVQL